MVADLPRLAKTAEDFLEDLDDGDLLFRFTADEFRKVLREIHTRFGIDGAFLPSGLRGGGATATAVWHAPC